MERILVTGAMGQLGTELVLALQKKYGNDHVIVTDIHPTGNAQTGDAYIALDVLDLALLREIVEKHQISHIYHLAALLSARAEDAPATAWKINMDGLLNILELAKGENIHQVFWPSSIAVYGPDAPKDPTPQHAATNPKSIYGVTKVAGEKLCAYYHQKYGVDVRSLRYPGLIGYRSLPGGGTTDYAVEIFYEALKKHSFSCPISAETMLPMMYMDDAVAAAIELMQADRRKITVDTSYNVAGTSFSPAEIASSIATYIPGFEMHYQSDFRQEIASSWPNVIDDSQARKDWGWKASYDLAKMVDEMVRRLSERLMVPMG